MSQNQRDERVRVLIVDDSAFARKVLRESLAASPLIEVVDIARDGLEALEKIAALRPEVITLDLVMPLLDGLGVLRALDGPERPEVLVVSVSGVDSALGVEALQMGAFDLVHKPTALATQRLYDMSGELVRKTLAAAAARKARLGRGAVPPDESARVSLTPVAPVPALIRRPELIVIGTSTGGPQALTRLLVGLPADFPVPIVIALHIPEGYTDAMAQRLDSTCSITVREAEVETRLAPGLAVLGRGGSQIDIDRRADGALVARTIRSRPEEIFSPSVDRLFRTAAGAAGAGTLGVVLTGMGSDGLLGSQAIIAAGGRVLTEAESSCVVYGMPRVVVDAGLSAGHAPLEQMRALITSLL